ncbi:hypothetical protein V6N11_045520 [Hibiscus sabdariffa]|uniref:Uncharacterized protein n=1 Tax=Hibiscus sabdariffa TaxID=183260 RepID=A0ABR2Q1A9_9ROSI
MKAPVTVARSFKISLQFPINPSLRPLIYSPCHYRHIPSSSSYRFVFLAPKLNGPNSSKNAAFWSALIREKILRKVKMNRSFIEETIMQVAALKQWQQLRASAMKEKEEELALFLEMRRREREQSNLLLNHPSGDFDAPLGSKPGASLIFNLSASTTTPVRNTGGTADGFLNCDSGKNDYECFLASRHGLRVHVVNLKICASFMLRMLKDFGIRALTPPGTPLFPSLEMESQKTVLSRIGTPKARSTAVKSRVWKISRCYKMDYTPFVKF